MTTTTDYSHRYHAGNIGDVWKHCALCAFVDALVQRPDPLRLVETHAGAGAYPLGPTGEWEEGIGRLRGLSPPGGALGRYLELVGRLGHARRYPGSPLLALALLREGDRATLVELVPETRAELAREVGTDPRATILDGDGLALLPSLLAEPGETLVLIDPTYQDKREWQRVADLLLELAPARPSARFLLWYPVKSLTRPNALVARLQQGGLAFCPLELLTTPIESRRNRLNGSGVILVRPIDGVVAAMAASAPLIGARCATRGWWSARQQGWGP